MIPETTGLIEKIIPAIFALLGTFVGALGAIIITAINKRSEERRQVRELAFTAGIENWKGACEFAKRNGGAVSPLDHYLVHMKLLSEKFLEGKTNSSELEEKLQELKSLSAQFGKYLEENSKSKGKKGN
ncbi:MAG: hypothetical protein ABIE75_04640 [Candidatus Omnitrophota bacterium]